ncbi:hypothetical protein ACFFRR_006510 [Megaselia abdita]
MLWILRRTGAANFFNSTINNNNDKNVKRPHRKDYGRLSMDSDDGISQLSNKSKIDNPLNLNNFEILHNGKNLDVSEVETTDIHGNFMQSNHSLNDERKDTETDCCGKTRQQHTTEINANTLNMNTLHSMDLSDDEDYDESLTCNVCDRAFHCQRQLASHQQKKRHFGCTGCDSLFPSLMLLEHHKEEFEHWSEDEGHFRGHCCRRNRDDFYFTDTDSFTSEAESEDLERLL